MTVRGAIEALLKIEAEGHGDLEIIGMTEVDGRFAIDEGRVFDVVVFPCEEDFSKGNVVCAFMEPIEEFEPQSGPSSPKPRGGLKLVS